MPSLFPTTMACPAGLVTVPLKQSGSSRIVTAPVRLGCLASRAMRRRGRPPARRAAERTSSTGGTNAGRVIVYSGRTGRVLFDHRGTVAGETLGYDAVGLGDVNRDGRVDLLVSAAVGDAVYVVSTRRRS
jgi:hypothetical protein